MVFRQAQSRCSIYRQQSQIAGRYPVAFSKNALLPTFLAMAEFAPSQWAKVKTGSDFKCVFEFAKENGEFIEYLNYAMLQNQDPSLGCRNHRRGADGLCRKRLRDDLPRRRQRSEAEAGGAIDPHMGSVRPGDTTHPVIPVIIPPTAE